MTCGEKVHPKVSGWDVVKLGSGLLKISMDYICYNRVAGSTVNMQALTCRVDVLSVRGGAHIMRYHRLGDEWHVHPVHTCGAVAGTVILQFARRAGGCVLEVRGSNRQNPFGQQAEQVHGDVRIGAMTCHQGNLSMPDAAVADRELDRAHGARNRASSPPLESRSQRG